MKEKVGTAMPSVETDRSEKTDIFTIVLVCVVVGGSIIAIWAAPIANLFGLPPTLFN